MASRNVDGTLTRLSMAADDMPATLDQTQGCLLGLALGDAFGAPFEGGFLERSLWRMIGTNRRGERRWTDDTQMTIDVIESFLAHGTINTDDLALRFARSYRWSRGYGPGAAKILRRIAAGLHWSEANRSVYPQGSYGNGAAMRAPLIGLIFLDLPDELSEAVLASAVVTHAHPLGIAGAMLIARATVCILQGLRGANVLREAALNIEPVEFTSRLQLAREWLDLGRESTPRDVVRHLGRGVAAPESCVTALYLAVRSLDQPLEILLQFIAACGGDADTIGAMAGALWGAANGYQALPTELLGRLEAQDRLLNLATALQQQLKRSR